MKKKSKKSKSKKAKSDNVELETTGDESTGDEPRKRKSVDYEAFTRTWTDATSVAEVAETFDIKPVSATAIASRLRKKGIKLKHFARKSAQEIDVAKLNRIASGKDD